MNITQIRENLDNAPVINDNPFDQPENWNPNNNTFNYQIPTQEMETAFAEQ